MKPPCSVHKCMQQTRMTFIFLCMLLCPSALQGKKDIVVLITARNNKDFLSTLYYSVITQDYEQFRVIYVDDASDDGSIDALTRLIATSPPRVAFTLVRHTTRRGKLHNVYNAIHSCDDQEVIVLVDGDDSLSRNDALTIIDGFYIDGCTWMTYGQDIPSCPTHAAAWGLCPSGGSRETPPEVIAHNSYRQSRFVYMHPRTFYAWLFKKIALADLIAQNIPGFEGHFYPFCNDFAILYPMLEMAGKHVLFNSIPLYIYNVENPSSGFRSARKLQLQCGSEIRKRASYTPIDGYSPSAQLPTSQSL